MEGPANTPNYMLAGFGLTFGIRFVYLGSVVVRYRNLPGGRDPEGG